MSTEQTTRNEAADYLRAIHAGTYRAQKLDEALATERRNVVEQVRDSIAHALAMLDEVDDLAKYGDSIESSLLEAHATLSTLTDRLDSIATGTEEEGK